MIVLAQVHATRSVQSRSLKHSPACLAVGHWRISSGASADGEAMRVQEIRSPLEPCARLNCCGQDGLARPLKRSEAGPQTTLRQEALTAAQTPATPLPQPQSFPSTDRRASTSVMPTPDRLLPICMTPWRSPGPRPMWSSACGPGRTFPRPFVETADAIR